MYNTRRRSELLDSLDYLIPPVKKLPRTVYKEFLYNDVKLNDQERLLRDCHRTVFGNPCWSKTSESDVQTCSSLILKKTTKQLIHEQYSILNLSTCNHGPDLYIQNKAKQRKGEKPIIKVTVIPKAKETQTSSVFNKRCRYSKTIQSTVSNQENFIKNQNIYLLTKGRKREKIHELKISESAKLSNRDTSHKYGDISIKQITESKQIINSLNMDKKKRKDNKNKKVVRAHIANGRETPKDRYGEKVLNPNDHNGRVTVVGQIGLSQEDRYILKCAAAVNNQPIETNFIKDDANPSRLIKNYNYYHSFPCRPPGCNINNCETFRQFRQQDSDIQTDIGNTYCSPGIMQKNRGTNQSTQVNFNFPNPQSIKKFRNQTAQCNSNHEITTTSLDTEEKDKVLKECKSPLVIISVYPRQEKGTNENDTVKIIQRHTSPERKEVTNIVRSNITQENFKPLRPGQLTNTVESKIAKSRSPSPKPRIGSKKNIENKTESRGRNNNSVYKCGLNQTRSHKSYIRNSLEGQTSCHCNDLKLLQTEDFNRQQIKINKSKDTEEVKKALVNNFLRNVNVMDKDNRKSRIFQPKDDASKITINIDGDNDRYDVLLERSRYDTGVSIKKTTKAQPAYQNFSSEEEVNTKSLENFLLVPNERRRKIEYRQETESTQPEPGVLKINPTASRLNIKDSIEIFRRNSYYVEITVLASILSWLIVCTIINGQGEHSNYNLKPHLKNDKKNFADTVFNSNSYAPVKHYRGDDCSISDPNERDREIRDLLGIMRCQPLQNTNILDSQITRFSCCCPKKCSTGLMTGSSISKFFPSKYLKRKNKSTHTKNEATQIVPRVKETKLEKSDSSHKKQHEQHKTSRKSKILQKSEKKHVSEHQEPKESQEETSETPEQTTEDFSKEPPVHHKSDNIINSNSNKQKNISNKEKSVVSKTMFEKEASVKAIHDPTVHMNDSIRPKNLILNRNVQIFLQVEQFTKERPVVLTRKQYDKVKRIIECTISKKLSIEKRKRCSLKNCNVVSIGEIKVKPKLQLPLRFNREIQTNRSAIKKIANIYEVKYTRALDTKPIINNKTDKQIATDVLVPERIILEQVLPRQTVSSMEIRYASVEYKKRVIISSSSTRFKNDNIHSLHTNNAERNSNSMHTIFKGHKRSATPNLGTSAFSLYSNLTDFSKKSYKQPQCAGDFKPKKPFLQRLISCLIMRSTQTSIIKKATHLQKLPSANNSLDSYHISTSLGALEMTSSLYDTSASFYSNHTTMPVSKIKRGFFSSVRGFLTSRRS